GRRSSIGKFLDFLPRPLIPTSCMAGTLSSKDDTLRVDAFIERWSGREGGAERANYQLFLLELCDLIQVSRPDPAGSVAAQNDYVFERAVRFQHEDGTTSPGRIDLYKKGSFVLEAKQSKKRLQGGEVYEQLAFALELDDAPKRRRSTNLGR